ncbi:transcription termination factor Rho [Corynebacterium sp. HMSC076C10]|uniref:transcription termination factor Rho n=1 Tax=Corynebacterium sp. HMSC076C10 TaxID=1739361 RepID=UPI0008A21E17|nr:transcription termination factor Rho [Corynebacterium sp. HMSC076C10]OFJ58095.1 transcription termination factor Rho [Corynebacterium sp. HMSC076C10]
MTDTDTTATAGGPENLAALRMAELREIASSKGIRGISAMRKHELIEAIKNGAPAAGSAPARKSRAKKAVAGAADTGSKAKDAKESPSESADKGFSKSADKSDKGNDKRDDANADGREEMSRSQQRRNRRNRARQREQENQDDRSNDSRDDSDNGNDRGERNDNRNDRNDRNDRGDRNDRNNHDRDNDDEGRGNRNNRRGRNNNRNNHDDDGRGNRNRRNRRNRRDRRGRDNNGGGHGGQDEIREDDVLQPVAGIVDVLDNKTAFVRTSGYLPGSNDVLVSAQMVRKYGLRKGDAVTGQVRMPRENGSGQVTHGNGRNRRKYNPLVKVETVNGINPEQAKQRPNFAKLTPLYPNRRLRLETEQKILTTRVIDLIMPIGKGQRALIVSPPKAGKTTILQNIANAIATNNPECYMMVVLVDERPEEVTDMQRSVRGEVIASTFDRPPSDHTAVAELAIERAKRLVEQGQDVVVLLDSITRLGRAYNNSSPASGRILSGGVDSNALYPPKRFLGAARNIEEGGSLTIIATAMVETGSAGDTVIFEEFKGTGNAELKLDRKISERRVFPAVDVNPSGTRKDELLLSTEEARIMHKLRRILSALESQAAIDLLIKQLKKTRNNKEFLMQVASSAPMAADVDVDDML